MHFLLTNWSIRFRSIVSIAETKHIYFFSMIMVFACPCGLRRLRLRLAWYVAIIIVRDSTEEEVAERRNKEHGFIIGMGHNEEPYLYWLMSVGCDGRMCHGVVAVGE